MAVEPEKNMAIAGITELVKGDVTSGDAADSNPYQDGQPFEKSAVKDSTPSISKRKLKDNGLTQNQIQIESEKASERYGKAETFGKEQYGSLQKYASEAEDQQELKSRSELNVNAPLQDKSLQNLIKDDNVHKYAKLQ